MVYNRRRRPTGFYSIMTYECANVRISNGIFFFFLQFAFDNRSKLILLYNVKR